MVERVDLILFSVAFFLQGWLASGFLFGEEASRRLKLSYVKEVFVNAFLGFSIGRYLRSSTFVVASGSTELFLDLAGDWCARHDISAVTTFKGNSVDSATKVRRLVNLQVIDILPAWAMIGITGAFVEMGLVWIPYVQTGLLLLFVSNILAPFLWLFAFFSGGCGIKGNQELLDLTTSRCRFVEKVCLRIIPTVALGIDLDDRFLFLVGVVVLIGYAIDLCLEHCTG